MSATLTPPNSPRWLPMAGLLARWLLGGLFLFLGASKVLHPAEFLVAIRQYQVIQQPLLLNSIAASLPWLEILCGLFLVAGVGVRGSALLTLGLLAGFNLLVLHRALILKAASPIPFCAIRFDCGCGAGEVFVCQKLLENALLMLLALGILIWRVDRACLRYGLWPFRNP